MIFAFRSEVRRKRSPLALQEFQIGGSSLIAPSSPGVKAI
jgi:hypothetical protein